MNKFLVNLIKNWNVCLFFSKETCQEYKTSVNYRIVKRKKKFVEYNQVKEVGARNQRTPRTSQTICFHLADPGINVRGLELLASKRSLFAHTPERNRTGICNQAFSLPSRCEPHYESEAKALIRKLFLFAHE